MRDAHAGGRSPRSRMSVSKAWQMTVAQAKFFVRMLTGDVSIEEHLGLHLASRTTRAMPRMPGPVSFLMLLVLLSLSLGFLNLLPIPILDGGQIVFQLVEWVKGGPLSDRAYMVGPAGGPAVAGAAHGRGAVQRHLSGIFGVHKEIRISRGLT